MRELARRLDMAPSNLYNYVTNENELRAAILHAHFIMSSEGFAQITEMQGKTYLEMMEALIMHFYESNGENSWAATELMSLSPDGGHSLELGLMMKPFCDLIEKAVNAGEVPEQDVEFSALYIWSLLQGSAIMLRLAELSNLFDAARTEDYVEYVADVVISSLKSMTAS